MTRTRSFSGWIGNSSFFCWGSAPYYIFSTRGVIFTCKSTWQNQLNGGTVFQFLLMSYQKWFLALKWLIVTWHGWRHHQWTNWVKKYLFNKFLHNTTLWTKLMKILNWVCFSQLLKTIKCIWRAKCQTICLLVQFFFDRFVWRVFL